MLSACAGRPPSQPWKRRIYNPRLLSPLLPLSPRPMAAIPTETRRPAYGAPRLPPTDHTSSRRRHVVATLTSQPAASGPTADPCNKPLTAWQGPSASLNIVYDYSPQGKDDKVVVSLWVMTDAGECGFLSDLSYGPAGQYTARAYVDGKKDFKVSGGFRITEAGWDIVIRNDKIIALGGCYPNC
ncbi:MAG: hypothetical protein MZV70_21625 [Desulfobacterales bacterium]|nr:hypothetical protein [Desulfobacterales bacterium]